MAADQGTQFETAQRMYSTRAVDYENSWHPQYTGRFMDIVAAKAGDRVLVLACGTGLEIAIAAPLVGDDGIVVGIDATSEMLAEARKKQTADSVLAQRLALVQHDITDLSSCAEIEKETFDLILCSNAFVLLQNPGQVVAHWRDFLKPGGRMVIDITHEYNLRAGQVLENVARRMGIPFPSNRSWIKSKDSFREVLQSQGLVVDRIETVEKELGKGTTYLDVTEADEQYEYIANSPLTGLVTTNEFKAKARPLFKEEWEAAAVDGKMEVSDTLYVYVARKV